MLPLNTRAGLPCAVPTTVCLSLSQERESELGREAKRQERNEELRKTFAQHANSFHAWLTDTRTSLMDGLGTLEEQLEAVKVHIVIKYPLTSLVPRIFAIIAIPHRKKMRCMSDR